MSQDNSHGNGDSPRQPPRFVPTLTQMVGAAESGPALATPSQAQPSSAMPAVFADLLKDWPALGNSPAQESQPKESALHEDFASEQIAQRAEALVMQRLPALMAGLVSQSVRDAVAELNANQPQKR